MQLATGGGVLVLEAMMRGTRVGIGVAIAARLNAFERSRSNRIRGDPREGRWESYREYETAYDRAHQSQAMAA